MRHRKPEPVQPCPGPLVWFDAGPAMCGCCLHGVLECAACGYIVATGNFHDDLHSETPLMREGLAA